MCVHSGDYEYELWLRYDLYTDKHTQWFYFSFSNTRPNVQYRFTIVNLLKVNISIFEERNLKYEPFYLHVQQFKCRLVKKCYEDDKFWFLLKILK